MTSPGSVLYRVPPYLVHDCVADDMQDRGAALNTLAGHFWQHRSSADTGLPLPDSSSQPATAAPIHRQIGSQPLQTGLLKPALKPSSKFAPLRPSQKQSDLATELSSTASHTSSQPASHLHSQKQSGAGVQSSPAVAHPSTRGVRASPRMRSPGTHQQPLASASKLLPGAAVSPSEALAATEVRNHQDTFTETRAGAKPQVNIAATPCKAAEGGIAGITGKAAGGIAGKAAGGTVGRAGTAGKAAEGSTAGKAAKGGTAGKVAEGSTAGKVAGGSAGRSRKTAGGSAAPSSAKGNAGASGKDSKSIKEKGDAGTNLPGSPELALQGGLSDRKARATARRQRQAKRASSLKPLREMDGPSQTAKQDHGQTVQEAVLSSPTSEADCDPRLKTCLPSTAGSAGTAGGSTAMEPVTGSIAETGARVSTGEAADPSHKADQSKAGASKAGKARQAGKPSTAGKADHIGRPGSPQVANNLTKAGAADAAGAADKAGAAGAAGAAASSSAALDRSLSDREARAAARADRRAAKLAGQVLQAAGQAPYDCGSTLVEVAEALPGAGPTPDAVGQAPETGANALHEAAQAPAEFAHVTEEATEALPGAGQTPDAAGQAPGAAAHALPEATQVPDELVHAPEEAPKALPGAGEALDATGQAPETAAKAVAEATQAPVGFAHAPEEAAEALPVTGQIPDAAGQAPGPAAKAFAEATQAAADLSHAPKQAARALPGAGQALDGTGQALEGSLHTDTIHADSALSAALEAQQTSQSRHSPAPYSTANASDQQQVHQGLHSANFIPQSDGAGEEEASGLSQPQSAAAASMPANPSSGHTEHAMWEQSCVSSNNSVGASLHAPLQAPATGFGDSVTNVNDAERGFPSVLAQIAARYMTQGNNTPSSSIKFTGIASDLPSHGQMPQSTLPQAQDPPVASDALTTAPVSAAQQLGPQPALGSVQHQVASDALTAVQVPSAQQAIVSSHWEVALQHSGASSDPPSSLFAPMFSQTAADQSVIHSGMATDSGTHGQMPGSGQTAHVAAAKEALHAHQISKAHVLASDAHPVEHVQLVQTQQAAADYGVTNEQSLNSDAGLGQQVGLPAQALPQQPALSKASDADTDRQQNPEPEQAAARQLDSSRVQAASIASQLDHAAMGSGPQPSG